MQMTHDASDPRCKLIPGNILRKLFRTNSWELFQDFLMSSWGISWDILSIFLSKFTDQVLTTILAPYRSITNQNVIVVFVFDFTEVVLYFVFSYQIKIVILTNKLFREDSKVIVIFQQKDAKKKVFVWAVQKRREDTYWRRTELLVGLNLMKAAIDISHKV